MLGYGEFCGRLGLDKSYIWVWGRYMVRVCVR